jgi:hypothetical protein
VCVGAGSVHVCFRSAHCVTRAGGVTQQQARAEPGCVSGVVCLCALVRQRIRGIWGVAVQSLSLPPRSQQHSVGDCSVLLDVFLFFGGLSFLSGVWLVALHAPWCLALRAKHVCCCCPIRMLQHGTHTVPACQLACGACTRFPGSGSVAAAAASFGLSVPAEVIHFPGLSDPHHWPSATDLVSAPAHIRHMVCPACCRYSTLVLVPLVNPGRQDTADCASPRLPLLHLGRGGSNNHGAFPKVCGVCACMLPLCLLRL